VEIRQSSLGAFAFSERSNPEDSGVEEGEDPPGSVHHHQHHKLIPPGLSPRGMSVRVGHWREHQRRGAPEPASAREAGWILCRLAVDPDDFWRLTYENGGSATEEGLERRWDAKECAPDGDTHP
jgi:hypothetical protein